MKYLLLFLMLLACVFHPTALCNEYSEAELLNAEKELAVTAPESHEMFSILFLLSQRYRKTDLNKSKEYYLKLLSLSEKRFGKNSKYSVIFCLGLGNISVEQKKFLDAEKYYSQGSLLAKNLDDIKSLTECQRRLFLMFIEQNEHEKAIDAGKNLIGTLKIQKQSTIWAENALASVYLNMRNTSAARPLLDNLISLKEAYNDPECLSTILYNINVCYKRIGNRELWRIKGRECINLMNKYWSDSPQYALVFADFCNEFGVFCWRFGYYKEAEDIYLMAKKQYTKHLPSDHRKIEIIYQNLGELYRDMNELEKAEQHLLHALKLQEDDSEDDHLIEVLGCLGNCYIEQNRYIEAEKYLKRALDIAERIPDKNDRLAKLYSSMASIIFVVYQDFDNALKYEQKGLQHNSSTNTIGKGISLSNIGYFYLMKGDYVSAEKYLQQAINSLIQGAGQYHKSVGNAEKLLASAYLRQKSYSKARQHFLHALEIIQKNYGNYSEDILKIYEELYVVAVFMQDENGKNIYLKQIKLLDENIRKHRNDVFINVYDSIGTRTLLKKDIDKAITDSNKLIWQHLTAGDFSLLLPVLNNLSRIALCNVTTSEKVFIMLQQLLDNLEHLPQQDVVHEFYRVLLESDLFVNHKHKQRKIISKISDSCQRSRNVFMYILLAQAEFISGNDADALLILDKLIQKEHDPENKKRLQQVYCSMLFKYNNENCISAFEKYLAIYHPLNHPPQTEDDFIFVAESVIQKGLFKLLNQDNATDLNDMISINPKCRDAISFEAAQILSNISPQYLSINSSHLRLSRYIANTEIKKFSPIFRQSYSFILSLANESAEAKRWSSEETQPIATILNAITLSNQTSICDDMLNNLLKRLDKTNLSPFEINGLKYSELDMKYLWHIARAMVFCKQKKYSMLDSELTYLETIKDQVSTDIKSSVIFYYNTLWAESKFAHKKYTEAIIYWKNACEYLGQRGGSSPVLEMRLGDAFCGQHNYQTALSHYRLAYEKFSEYHDRQGRKLANFRMALVLYKRGQFEEAKKILRSQGTKVAFSPSANMSPEDELLSLIDFCIKKDSRKITRKQKQDFFQNWYKQLAYFKSPIAAECYLQAAFFREQNIDEQMPQYTDLEKYFDLIQAAGMSMLNDGFIVLDRRNETYLQEMFLLALSKGGSPVKFDYWNKIFSTNKVRRTSFIGTSTTMDNDNLPDITILEIITKYQEAKQILAREEKKSISMRDDRLILWASEECRKLMRLFEQNKKHLSKEKYNRLYAILIDDSLVIQPDTLTQLGTILPEDTLCIQFVLSGDSIFVYMVGKQIPPILKVIELTAYDLSNKKFMTLLLKTRNMLQSPESANSLAAKRSLQHLYDVIFREIDIAISKNKITKILVSSTGELRYIPFGVLFDGKKYLVEKFQISNVTGVDLIRLAKNPASPQIENINTVIFANPTQDSVQDALPQAENEAKYIASIFPKTTIYANQNANLKILENMLGQVNILHLATHAVLDSSQPNHSYILFANGEKWYYCDMLSFNVSNLDLITLSACSTAMKKSSNGDEIEGMAFQLLKTSPSGSILASFWNVDDAATAELMKIFYSEIGESIKKNQIMNKGAALRSAQLKLLKNPATASPYYWAAFTLFGDFR